MRRLVIFVLLVIIAGLAASALPAGATYPGANGKIAFRSDGRTAGHADIWVMNPDGSGLTRLTTDAAADTSSAWSPDGKKIAFDTARGGCCDIYLMNADGSGQTQLTTNPAAEDSPTWSPDASKVAYSSHRDPLDVYVINVNGTGEANLTNNPEWNDWDPSWCPDGKIVFTSNRDETSEIYVMNPDGSGQTQLTTGGGEHPSCSPDSTKIAFMSQRDGNQEIYVMGRDGSSQTRLTNDTAWDREPAWSPDGLKIAFRSDRGPGADIWVMNPDGSGQTNLTNDGWGDFWPSWQPLLSLFPPADTDTLNLELRFSKVMLDEDNDGDPETDAGPATFAGPVTVTRGDPYVSGGRWVIDTEIELNLTGTAMGFPATIKAGTAGLTKSEGKITEQAPGTGFPADSFFDVFFEIETDNPNYPNPLRNCDEEPATFTGAVTKIPAIGVVHSGGDVLDACEPPPPPPPGGAGGVVPLNPGFHRVSAHDPRARWVSGVGGVAKMPDIVAGSDSAVGSSSGSGFNYTALGAALGAAAGALAAGAWFARRRWLT